MNFKELVKSKTFWAGVTAIVAGVQGLITGTPDIGQSIQLVVGGFIAIFLRQGIAKVGQ